MFEDLATAIHTLDTCASGPEIAALAALHHQRGIRIAQAAHTFNDSGFWGADGAVSAKGWLTAHSQMSENAASRLLKTGRTLHALPVTATAVLDDEIGSGQLEAILAVVGNSHLEKFASFETTLIPQFVGLDPRRTAIAMQHWKNVVTSDDPPASEPPESVHLNNLPDGRYALNGTLSEDTGSTVTEAIRAATTNDSKDEAERTPAQRRADALRDICQFYLDCHPAAGPALNRAAMVVVVDVEVLERRSPGVASRLDGKPLKRAVLDRIACDCDIHRMITNGPGVTIDFGRKTRLISDRLRAVINARDGGCRFPGCRKPPSDCQIHHVVPWPEQGTTDQTNLVSQCLRHHQIIHTAGWHNKLLPGGIYELVGPTGKVLHSYPRGTDQPTLALV